MKITLYGAAGGEVTGSCYYVKTSRASILVDHGLFQGRRATEGLNRSRRMHPPAQLDSVILTHAHLDHTGRLPLLTAGGFRGSIYATPATMELSDLILHDSARLQEGDVERENRKRKRSGQPPVEVLYHKGDVEKIHPLYSELEYNTSQEIAPGISARVVEAGHMLGSVSIELTIVEEGRKKVVVFSGDLGPRGAPLHRDSVPFKHADVVFLESTYGDRDHRSLRESEEEVRAAIARTLENRGKILVPVFAVGRTQVLIYLLARAFKNGVFPPFPIYIDSPMAIEATKIYRDHVELYDEEALEMVKSGDMEEYQTTLRFSQSADDSRALNDKDGPLLIMAGSGMCTGGRILHHLRHNLAHPRNTVFIVGYQSHGSLGRMLVDRHETVTIFGEKIPVRASVHTIGGLSGHAGQTDLLKWLGTLSGSRPRVILTHGEEKARVALSSLIKERSSLVAERPGLGETIEV